MTITVTLKGVLLTAIAVLVIIALIYLIILLNNLIKTLKQTNLIMEDAKLYLLRLLKRHNRLMAS